MSLAAIALRWKRLFGRHVLFWSIFLGALALSAATRAQELLPPALSERARPAYDTWLRRDFAFLTDRHADWVRNGRRGPRERAQLRAEERALATAIARLEASPDYVDPKFGFRVYAPDRTGWLFALSQARSQRQMLRTLGPGWRPDEEALYRFSGYDLVLSPPERQPELDQVISALHDLRLPPAMFDGYRIYLSPYSLVTASGLGGNGYGLISGAPPDETWADDQTYFTAGHEFGHNVQFRYLGGSFFSHPGRWLAYLRLRGRWWWRPDGPAGTRDWRFSPEENFAEDVRVLFGSEKSPPHLGGYGDPRQNARLRLALRTYIAGLARLEPEPPDPGPWLRATPARSPAAAWALWAAIGFGALAAAAPCRLLFHRNPTPGTARRISASLGGHPAHG